MNFYHKSVLLEESLKYLNIRKNGVYIDGTLGGGGHSARIADKLDKGGILIGIDRDKDAITAARPVLKNYPCQVHLIHDNFKNLDKILMSLEIEAFDGLLLDLGVSSHQLDQRERGFSYQHDAKLDMRMNVEGPLTAKMIINNYSEKELENIIWEYGEERWARRIAEFIVKDRKKQEISTTYELVETIKKAIPKEVRRKGGHPARRTFQALRIEVNDELNIIDKTIKSAVKYLKGGGRICIITFHSLEDRIVKNTFRKLNDPCICPPDFPICACGKKKQLEIITRKPITPTKEEIDLNNRARSSKLRVAEKV